jgi:hypothetical protein
MHVSNVPPSDPKDIAAMADAYMRAADGNARVALELAIADASDALAELAKRVEIAERSVSFGYVYGAFHLKRLR